MCSRATVHQGLTASQPGLSFKPRVRPVKRILASSPYLEGETESGRGSVTGSGSCREWTEKNRGLNPGGVDCKLSVQLFDHRVLPHRRRVTALTAHLSAYRRSGMDRCCLAARPPRCTAPQRVRGGPEAGQRRAGPGAGTEVRTGEDVGAHAAASGHMMEGGGLSLCAKPFPSRACGPASHRGAQCAAARLSQF